MSFSNAVRCLPIALALVSAGCRDSYMPPSVDSQLSSLSSGQYPIRGDLMVVGNTGLDGAPDTGLRPAFPHSWSARTPHPHRIGILRMICAKQLGKNVIDPASQLNALQIQTIANLLELTFGIPAEPQISIPDWDSVTMTEAVARPDLSKGAFANIGALANALGSWEDAKRWKNDWASANRVNMEPRTRRYNLVSRLDPVPQILSLQFTV